MNKIQVLVVPVDSNPYLKTVENELEPLQKIVGGDIEPIGTKEGYLIVGHGEAKIFGFEPNIIIGGGVDTINGQFFVCKFDGGEDFASISKDEATDFLYRYVIGCKANPVFNVALNYKL